MKTIRSADVQKNFGALIDLVASGETVRITRYGRPGVLVLADNDAAEAVVRQLAGQRLVGRLRTLEPKPPAEALSAQEIDRLIAECFD